MIRGMHAMFYSSRADELRAFLRDKLGLSATDVGGGWLIFNAPEADLGIHPTEGSKPRIGHRRHLVLLRRHRERRCASSSRAVSKFTQNAEDHGFGFVTFFNVPGGFKVQLYQPKYRK